MYGNGKEIKRIDNLSLNFSIPICFGIPFLIKLFIMGELRISVLWDKTFDFICNVFLPKSF